MRLTAYTDATLMGGAERLLRSLVGTLRPDVEVTLLGPDVEVLRAIAAVRPGTRLRAVPVVAGKCDLRGMRRFAGALRAARPDIVHLHLATPWKARPETLIALLAPGAKVVAVENLPLDQGSEQVRRVKRALARRLDAHVAVGDGAARAVERMVGLAPGSVRTIRVAVDDFSVERTPGERPRIGTIARLDPQKGLDVLLRALPDVDLEIVGDGPERAALEALAGERVTFAGWSEQARDWLGRWDAFVLPSRYEGLPLVIVEAMLAGLPVVATDVGSVAEAVADGETGLLVRPEDPAALRAALERLLGDAELAARLGRRGREVAVAEFTPGPMARRYEALYDELLA